MDDLVRWVAVAETSLFMVLSFALAGRYLARVGRDALPAAVVIAAHQVLVMVAIFVNIASPHPPTPGVKVYAAAMAPLVAALALIHWRTRRP